MVIMEPVRLRRMLLWLASFAWMGLIFWFSAQTATESSASSDSTLHFLLRFFRVDNMEEILADSVLFRLGTFILRKSAHLFVFAVLGFLFCAAVCQYPASRLQKIALPLSLGVLYACIDELHQYFVPGRACQIRDVCIDTAGVLIGVFLALLIGRLLHRRSAKKQAAAQ